MTDKRMIEELTRLNFPNCCYRSKREVYNTVDPYGHVYPSFYAPDYLTDHNAIQRVIDGMDELILEEYFCLLEEEFVALFTRWILMATPRQKCIAALRAYGKWEEGK